MGSTPFAALVRKLVCALALLGAGFAAPAAAAPVLLVYGDSLSAAYGIAQNEGWVTLLDRRVRQKQLHYTVVNASISGETSSGGASRIGAALARYKPRILILELGANDGLRGLPIKQMRSNLEAIIRAAQNARCQVLLVGMKMPPNYGPSYTRDFEQAFAALATQFHTAFVPFLLEGVAGKRDHFIDDDLHPTARMQPRILENVWRVLAPLLK